MRALQCRNMWCAMYAKMDTVLVRTCANTPPGATAAGDTEQLVIRAHDPGLMAPLPYLCKPHEALTLGQRP